MSATNSISIRGAWLLMLLCCAGLAYGIERTDFAAYFSLYSLWFLLYYRFVLKEVADFSKALKITIFCFPLLTLFAVPSLSDDYFRYLWDGRLWGLGTNAYSITPNQYLENQQSIDPYLQQLHPLLNSPTFYSVYPPLAQLSFALAGLCNSVYASTIVLRLIFLSCHWLCFWGIRRLSPDTQLAYIYGCNPFIINELIVNLHTEILMLPLLVWGYYFKLQQRTWASAFCLALAVAAKLLPLLLVPAWALWKSSWRAAFGYAVLVGVLVIMLFFPFFYGENLGGILQSLRLYFSYFEFNGSLYYLFARLIPTIFGYNAAYLLIIKSVFALATVGGILYLSIKNKEKNSFAITSLFIYTIYYMTATTVHPWYLSAIVLWGILAKQPWTQLWAWAIGATYITYSALPYQENYMVILVEYVLVLAAVLWTIKKNSSSAQTEEPISSILRANH